MRRRNSACECEVNKTLHFDNATVNINNEACAAAYNGIVPYNILLVPLSRELDMYVLCREPERPKIKIRLSLSANNIAFH